VAGTKLRTGARVSVDGQRLLLEGASFRLRGTTYGDVSTRSDGAPFPTPDRVLADLIAIADAGLNTIRTRTLPPRDVLELAAELGLRVLASVDYRDWRTATPTAAGRARIRAAGLRAVDAALSRCAGRREVLALTVGRELAADVIAAHGVGHIGRQLSELAAEVRAAGLLATYVTALPPIWIEGLDFASFATPGLTAARLAAEVRKLTIAATGLPLVVVDVAPRQLLQAERLGCAGAIVDAWPAA